MDITLAEYRTLTGKMDAADTSATTLEAYMDGTADWRTDLYATEGRTLMTHAESIELFRSLGAKFTPELKSPAVDMPHNGFSTATPATPSIRWIRPPSSPRWRHWPATVTYYANCVGID